MTSYHYKFSGPASFIWKVVCKRISLSIHCELRYQTAVLTQKGAQHSGCCPQTDRHAHQVCSLSSSSRRFVLWTTTPLERVMAPHSSTLAWKIPWTEEPGGLQSMGPEEWDTAERLHLHFSLSTESSSLCSSVGSHWLLLLLSRFSRAQLCATP